GALEEPDVRDGRREVDVPHALAPHLLPRHLDAAALADDALVADALVLPAVALPVARRPEDALAEQAVALGLERAVVDRLRLGDLAGRPVAHLLARRGSDPDRVEDIDLDQVSPLVLSSARLGQSSISASTRSGSPSGPTSSSTSSSASCSSDTSTSSRSPSDSSAGRTRSWSTRSCPSSTSSVVGCCPTARSEPGERSMPSSSAARSSSSSSSRTSTSRPSSERTWTSRASDCISLRSTLKDSGIDGSAMFSPLTIASYAFTRPTVSSDLIVSISCKVYAAPYASSAHTSISPKRWPPNWALPPRGCCVTSEYGPVERAWILSSTRWRSLRMYMKPTVTFSWKGSPVLPLNRRTFPEQRRPSGRFWATFSLIGESRV